MHTKKFLIAGCSHAAGFEINGDQDTANNRSMSFGNLLAKQLCYDPINIALGGQSNSAIARSVLLWIQDNGMPDFVLVAWSEPMRMDVPALSPMDYLDMNEGVDYYNQTQGLFNQVNVGWPGGNDLDKFFLKSYHEFILRNPNLQQISSAKEVIMLQNFLAHKDIPYLFCNSMEMFERNEFTSIYLDSILTSNYYQVFEERQGFYWKYKDMGYENSLAKWWHHGKIPHRLYADELHAFIKDRHIA